jgi:hypothetical protein
VIRRSAWRALLLAAWLLLCCSRSSEELAKLETKHGQVDRDFAAGLGKWLTAPVAASFKVGDGVRTAAGATAKLRLSDASNVVLQEKTLLRFLATPPGEKSRGLDVQEGEVELDVGNEELKIQTGSGPAVLAPGSRIRLSKTARGTRFAVEIGSALLSDAKRDVKAGETIEIGIGSAVLEPAPPSAPPSAATSAPAPPASVPGGESEAAQLDQDQRARGPETLDLLAAPGESLIIHDPRPPTVVGFSGARCSGITVLEVGAKRRETVGARQVSAAFAAGSQRYRLRCDAAKEPFAEGTIHVLSDSGTRRLAGAAPSNRIDADGRRYTILYQGLLPRFSVRWPNPPSTGPFALQVRSAKGVRRFAGAGPSVALPGGTLAEGSHELWFEAGGQRSRSTTVVVQFDNAAPTASISAPAERSFAPGATVAVAGSALPGWTVSVQGRELAQDGQHRFSGEASAPTDVRALAIRFSHPARGVHYYLRRSSR